MLARDVRAVTGYDRVMVYRFDAEWNGEVIAEDRREDLEPFFGLRYPASDIPAQARALYATNWMRIIPDARYRPVPLEPPVHPRTGRPLDLSGAMLRSVSPVHLEYLANMGVVSSMSVSLIDRGTLWGLIACHHYAGPHRPSYTDRTAAEFLGRTASLLLHTTVAAGEQEGVVEVAQRTAELTAAVGRTPRALGAALTEGDVTVLDLLPAAGAAVRLNGQLRLLGTTPPAERVAPLVRALLAAGVTATDAVATVVPEAADLADTASGVLAVPVGSRGLPRLVPAGDAARGQLGRQPVPVEDRADRRRPAAEPAALVRGLERDGPRDVEALAGARGRRRPRARRAPHRGDAQPRRGGQPAGRRAAAHPAARGPAEDPRRRAGRPVRAERGGRRRRRLVRPGAAARRPGGVRARRRGRARPGRRRDHRPAAARAARPPAARRRAGRRAGRAQPGHRLAAARGDGDGGDRGAGPGRPARSSSPTPGTCRCCTRRRPGPSTWTAAAVRRSGCSTRSATPRRGGSSPATTGCCCSATA